MRIQSLIFFFFIVASAADAHPRGKQQMLQIATDVLAPTTSAAKGRAGALRDQTVKVLDRRDGLTVYAAADGKLAVIAADDMAPAVLGIGQESDTDNPHFKWWLEMTDAAVKASAASQKPLTVTKPDGSKFKTSVDPLTHTEWGQQAPFNNLCPIAQNDTRCLTGCVATSIAQVLYFHQGPKHGYGRRTIYYPQYDNTGTPVYVDFSNEDFDWQSMLTSYKNGYTEREATAVATLMRDVGVAVNMNYGEGASGAYHTDAAEGLKSYLGIESARRLSRSAYTETEWMNMLYEQLNDSLPVVYGGADAAYGGHSFVVDGYDSEGRMHINWGWNGDDNGYYYLLDLSPKSRNYTFSQGQDAIVDIRVDGDARRYAANIRLTVAGTLADSISADKKLNYDSLTVSGPLNGSDIRLIREMAGRDAKGQPTDGRLRVLDLSGATIVAGGEAYLTEKGAPLTTADDALSRRMFYGCSLVEFRAPRSLRSFGNGALALCTRLDSVWLTPDNNATFRVDGDIVYNSQGDEVISVLPSAKNRIAFAKGVTTLHDDCLSGCNHVKHVVMASTVQKIGAEAFNDCIGLIDLKTYAKTVPALSGDNVFNGISDNVKLYVPRGTKAAYAKADQWDLFSQLGDNNIVEFGTTIKARNAVRQVGQDNPRFSYQVIGDYVEGTAELTCEATKDSPAGKYAIHVLPGTITDEGVEYIDGWLMVTPATGVDAVTVTPTFDVYSLQGKLVKSHVTNINSLSPGVYIINGKKIRFNR